MNRHDLFKLLFGGVACAVAAVALPPPKPEPDEQGPQALWGMHITTSTFSHKTGQWEEKHSFQEYRVIPETDCGFWQDRCEEIYNDLLLTK